MTAFPRGRIASAALGAALMLAAAGPAPAQDDAPGEAPLPNGNGCAGAIARWQETADRENKGGHMDLSVYNKIQDEIDRASHLCQAGEDAQARRLVADSKRRHGYPQ